MNCLTPATYASITPRSFGLSCVIAGPADLRVPPDALGQVVLIETLGPEDLGHRAGGAAVVLEQLLEPVLRLGVADRIRRILERRGVDVRDAELIAVEGRRRFVARARGRGPSDAPMRIRTRLYVARTTGEQVFIESSWVERDDAKD